MIQLTEAQLDALKVRAHACDRMRDALQALYDALEKPISAGAGNGSTSPLINAWFDRLDAALAAAQSALGCKGMV